MSAPTTGAIAIEPLRLYFVHTPLLGQPDQWQAQCERIAQLGFSDIVLSGALARSNADDVRLLGDLESEDVTLAAASDATRSGVGVLASICRELDLGLYVALYLARSVPNTKSPEVRYQPLPALDPRHANSLFDGQHLDWSDENTARTLQGRLTTRFASWRGDGVAGVLFSDVAGVAGGVVVDAARSARALGLRTLAWTPGCSPSHIKTLAEVPWDGVFNSQPWWDFRAPWIALEDERLRPLGPVVAPVAVPFDTGATVADVARAQRALWVAAASASGFMIPMGFEYGHTLKASDHGVEAWKQIVAQRPFDLSQLLTDANSWVSHGGGCPGGAALRPLTTADSRITVMWRQQAAADGMVIAINPDAQDAGIAVERILTQLPMAAGRLLRVETPLNQGSSRAVGANAQLYLSACEVGLFRPLVGTTIQRAPKTRTALARRLDEAVKAPRIAIESVTPQVDEGRFAVRRLLGEQVHVRAAVWMDGHEHLAAALKWRACDDNDWHEVRMQPEGNDQYAASFPLERLGRHEYVIEAWHDVFSSWLVGLDKKRAAGLDVSLEAVEGCALVEHAAAHAPTRAMTAVLTRLQKARSTDANVQVLRTLEILTDGATRAAMAGSDPRRMLSKSAAVYPIEAERLAAQFGSWYELFPRSARNDGVHHGTFLDVITQLPRIRAMGFDVLYFPPIHPIGLAHRKGRNNHLVAAADDPGSPYAIGGSAGGHDALHPELGSFEDFAALLAAARSQGLEIALDFAIQCSPDHPWLKAHPDWFAFRADGSLPYAENPPKKYEDIVNVDFYAGHESGSSDAAGKALWLALRDIVLFWVERGVHIFRVDNPHTKPLPFWEWMIDDVRARHPQTIFLAEAFTKPHMMARLAKIGFSQSYSYFTWRNEKWELLQYMHELSSPPLSEFFRPHFFVNTPDINPPFLQRYGRNGFLVRAALAATLSGLWGMYSGFELCESAAVPGKEEYLDSEKYELRARHWDTPGNITSEIARLNRIRLENPALHTHTNFLEVAAPNDRVLVFAKATSNFDNILVVAINLDPLSYQQTSFEMPFWRWGLADDAHVEVEDLVRDYRFQWQGKIQSVGIDAHMPFWVWRIEKRRG